MKYNNLITMLSCLFNLWTSYVKVDAALDADGIIGGDKAISDQFRYMITLQNSSEYHYCGGGIIGDRHILTAAHCVIDVKKNKFTNTTLSVLARVVDLNDHDDSVIRIEVEKIYVPQVFNPLVSALGDIAVLKLKEGLGLGENPDLSKLELPSEPFSTYVDDKAIITGFGWSSMNKIVNPNDPDDYEITGAIDGQLRFAEAKVMSNKQCSEILEETVKKQKLCARVNQRDSNKPEGVCVGDSGGPLVYNSTVVIGVASISYGCPENETPAIYTRVSAYVDFVRNAVMDKITSDMRVKS